MPLKTNKGNRSLIIHKNFLRGKADVIRDDVSKWNNVIKEICAKKVSTVQNSLGGVEKIISVTEIGR